MRNNFDKIIVNTILSLKNGKEKKIKTSKTRQLERNIRSIILFMKFYNLQDCKFATQYLIAWYY